MKPNGFLRGFRLAADTYAAFARDALLTRWYDAVAGTSRARARVVPRVRPRELSRPSEVRSAMEFKVGDKAVHPAHGVGEVTSIEKKTIAGNDKRFYILKIVDTGMTVMVPTDGAERLGLREVFSKREAKKVLDELKKDEVAVTSQPWNRRYREYTEMLKSGSPISVARVLRDLSRLRVEKELSFGERRLLEQARNLLVAELALAKQVKEEKVQKDLDAILG